MNQNLTFSLQAQTMFKSAASWAKFLAVLGFLNVLLVFGVAVGLMSLGTFLPQLNSILQNPTIPTKELSEAGVDISVVL